MKLRVLGCSGGIGGALRTTAFLVDDDILIDAGTGVGDLSLAEMAAIDHVFLTHAHLDHVACLPLMIDAVAERRERPLRVYATQAVLDVLQAHLFNGMLWPDFTRIPSVDAPWLSISRIEALVPVDIGGRMIMPLPVRHSVPAVGYALHSGSGALAFSGDMGDDDAFWRALTSLPDLRHLIVECAFPSAEAALAEISGHLVPPLLAKRLLKLDSTCHCYISHLKPGQAEQTMQEIVAGLGGRPLTRLGQGRVIEF